jgi:hypothetical protein
MFGKLAKKVRFSSLGKRGETSKLKWTVAVPHPLPCCLDSQTVAENHCASRGGGDGGACDGCQWSRGDLGSGRPVQALLPHGVAWPRGGWSV